MNTGKTVFSQLMDCLPIPEFRECVDRYRGNHRVRNFSCWDQFLCMAFAQLTFRDSLRDIETCLRATSRRLYHAGIRGHVSRSTLADANEHRDWRIYADFAQVLIGTARMLYIDDGLGLALKKTTYVFDSTTIDLCLSLFPWAQFRRHKSAVKLHTLMDLRGNIPCFIHISSGRITDMTALDDLVLEAGSFYVMDRGYIDFARLHRFTENMAFFVIRSKNNLACHRQSHRPVNKATGLRSDQTIHLTGPKSSHRYPTPLRRITYVDADSATRFVFLTNNFTLAASTIPRLYRCRWQVELFFKWIKQYLRIKAFYGTSINAVKTQIWIAIAIYVLVAILKKRLALTRSLSEILQILSITLFEKTPILQVISHNITTLENNDSHNQLLLLDF
jgi:hypothetical protein